MSRTPRRRLYLLRHAKSSWKQPDLADHDRPLSGRGRRAAKAIARHVREQRIAPELVLCSTARRTRETFERLEPAVGTPDVRFERELYGATALVLLDRLHRVPEETGSVLLIGHNPAIEELALDLARPSGARSELEAKFPTGALATLELAGMSWRELGRSGAELVGFVRPRDLERP
jgi:phosphohistidine phosphatase